MVRLIDIKKEGEILSCDAFVEDCKVPIHLSLNTRTGEFQSDELPAGIGYCDNHIAKARRYLKSITEAEEIPKQHAIIWY